MDIFGFYYNFLPIIKAISLLALRISVTLSPPDLPYSTCTISIVESSSKPSPDSPSTTKKTSQLPPTPSFTTHHSTPMLRFAIPNTNHISSMYSLNPLYPKTIMMNLEYKNLSHPSALSQMKKHSLPHSTLKLSCAACPSLQCHSIAVSSSSSSCSRYSKALPAAKQFLRPLIS